MVIYRPHVEFLYDAMENTKEFSDFDALKLYVSQREQVSVEDVLIRESDGPDRRTGWNDERTVLIRLLRYEHPIAVGHCATSYDPSVWASVKEKYLPY